MQRPQRTAQNNLLWEPRISLGYRLQQLRRLWNRQLLAQEVALGVVLVDDVVPQARIDVEALRRVLDVDAEEVVGDPAVLQALVPPIWQEIVARLAKRSAETLTPREFWLTIAKRGGFIARKRDGRPGWKTIWRGWYDVMIMVQGVELLAEARPQGCG